MNSLHQDDFKEMLERGDTLDRIARYCGVSTHAIKKRFDRLPQEVKEEIRAKRKVPIENKQAYGL